MGRPDRSSLVRDTAGSAKAQFSGRAVSIGSMSCRVAMTTALGDAP